MDNAALDGHRSAHLTTAQAEAGSRLCQPDPARPVYECPVCRRQAMQFFAEVPDCPDLRDVFFCCVCRMSWSL